MKFKHKCITCNREAFFKTRGLYFCDDCAKEINQIFRSRKNKPTHVYGSKLVYTKGELRIYRDIPIKIY